MMLLAVIKPSVGAGVRRIHIGARCQGLGSGEDIVHDPAGVSDLHDCRSIVRDVRSWPRADVWWMAARTIAKSALEASPEISRESAHVAEPRSSVDQIFGNDMRHAARVLQLASDFEQLRL